MKVKGHRLILVEWEDSILGYTGWKVIKDEPKRRVLFYSVGFVVSEDKFCITLYPHIEKTKDKSITGAGDIIIPKSAIRKIIKLKTK